MSLKRALGDVGEHLVKVWGGTRGAPGEGGKVCELHIEVPVQVCPRGGGKEPRPRVVQHCPLRPRGAPQLVHLDVVEPCDRPRAPNITALVKPARHGRSSDAPLGRRPV
eukprot:1176305-Prorocentrum_minimum.AAC.1